MSGSTGKPGPNVRRAAAVQRLKSAVAERREARERREAEKAASGGKKTSASERLRRNGSGA